MKPINKSKVDFRRLSKLIEEWDDKYSIKVGIIGDTAYQKHEHSDLSNADLGAIHEFGAIKKTVQKFQDVHSWLIAYLLMKAKEQ